MRSMMLQHRDGFLPTTPSSPAAQRHRSGPALDGKTVAHSLYIVNSPDIHAFEGSAVKHSPGIRRNRSYVHEYARSATYMLQPCRKREPISSTPDGSPRAKLAPHLSTCRTGSKPCPAQTGDTPFIAPVDVGAYGREHRRHHCGSQVRLLFNHGVADADGGRAERDRRGLKRS